MKNMKTVLLGKLKTESTKHVKGNMNTTCVGWIHQPKLPTEVMKKLGKNA